MKAKTIRLLLIKKFESFVKSIQDKKVRELVKENSIITGGCIASMLLNEDVNDYDIYFTDHETTLAVTEYYVNRFKENTSPMKFKDGSHAVDVTVIDKDGRVKIVVQSSGVATENEVEDYQYFETTDPGSPDTDQFIENVFSYSKAIKEKDSKTKYRPIYLTTNAITLSDKVQLVMRFYGDPEKIHSNYDFVHCTNYWESKNYKLTLRPDALEALLTKELIYVGSKYPLCSMIRLRKFIRRGWTVNAGQCLKIAFQINELDLKNPEVLAEQLLGVDTAYFSELLSIIAGDNKRDIDSAYISELVDKVF